MKAGTNADRDRDREHKLTHMTDGSNGAFTLNLLPVCLVTLVLHKIHSQYMPVIAIILCKQIQIIFLAGKTLVLEQFLVL